jgi:hypothetical protein
MIEHSLGWPRELSLSMTELNENIGHQLLTSTHTQTVFSRAMLMSAGLSSIA